MYVAKEANKILLKALGLEKSAEENCDKLLQELRVNGYHDHVEKIKNDEHRHQAMVQKLIELVK